LAHGVDHPIWKKADIVRWAKAAGREIRGMMLGSTIIVQSGRPDADRVGEA